MLANDAILRNTFDISIKYTNAVIHCKCYILYVTAPNH